jgi:8-oxo-dGTP diphosphatase
VYNIRVYGLWIKDGAVLVSDEFERGIYMTKFPGGGHEFGESLTECVIREFHEELKFKISVIRHFYTTDFFITSAFNSQQQLISHYYVVEPAEDLNFNASSRPFDFSSDLDRGQSFRWLQLSEIRADDFTFPIDRHVAGLLSPKI